MWLKQLLQAFYAGVTSRGVSYAVVPVALHAVPVFFRTIPAELNRNRLCSLFNQIQAKILSLRELSWLGKAVSSVGSHYQHSKQAPWIGSLRLQGCSPSFRECNHKVNCLVFFTQEEISTFFSQNLRYR